jgi:DNA-binding CsgD family transcriptional regulator
MTTPTTFIVTSLALFAGFFSLGAAAALLLRHRTRILKIAALFIASLLCLTLGFWLPPVAEGLSGAGAVHWRARFSLAANACQMLGVALTVGVSPILVAALIALPIPKPLAVALAAWDAILVVACLLYPVLAAFAPTLAGVPVIIVNAQLGLTVAGSVIALAARLADVKPLAARKAIKAFIAATAVFFAAFVADWLVSYLGVTQAAFLDNLGLPAFFLALNAGSFAFVARFLGAGPLVVRGRISPECQTLYGLTAREIELAERVLEGRSNQEIADALFISRKTVENHLYNIYQKLGVNNRIQFMRTLENQAQR